MLNADNAPGTRMAELGNLSQSAKKRINFRDKNAVFVNFCHKSKMAFIEISSEAFLLCA